MRFEKNRFSWHGGGVPNDLNWCGWRAFLTLHSTGNTRNLHVCFSTRISAYVEEDKSFKIKVGMCAFQILCTVHICSYYYYIRQLSVQYSSMWYVIPLRLFQTTKSIFNDDDDAFDLMPICDDVHRIGLTPRSTPSRSSLTQNHLKKQKLISSFFVLCVR